MERFVPQKKRSKKAQRALAAARRTTWGPLNPVTRRAENKMVYNRKKVRPERNDSFHAEPFIYLIFQPSVSATIA
jgi:hypothetical protein